MTAGREGCDGAEVKKKPRRRVPKHIEEQGRYDYTSFRFFADPSKPPFLGPLLVPWKPESKPEPGPEPEDEVEWA